MMESCPLAPEREKETEMERATDIDEMKLRELLWLGHGCPILCLYGDDGEMQCNNTKRHKPIDFLRNSPFEIEKLLKNLKR